MASSLIPINQATIEELQALKGIGPKRAGRIVRYRHEVAKIISVHDLATAAGISLKQANTLSAEIQWYRVRFKPTGLVSPIVTFIGSYLLVLFGFSEIRLDLTSPVSLLYNISLLLIMLGCISVTLEQFISFAYQQRITSRYLAVLAIGCSILGIVFMTSLVVLNLLLELSSAFSEKMHATTNFLIFVLMIIYLLHAPGFHLKHLSQYDVSASRRLDIAAIIYDIGQLVFALITLLILVRLNSEWWVEEIFALWASVMLVANGSEMVQGRSAYVSLLSDQEKAALRFVLAESSIGRSIQFPPRLLKITGITLVLIGMAILAIAVHELLFG